MKGGLSDSQIKLIEWLEKNHHWVVTTDEIASVLSLSQGDALSLGFSLSLKKWFAALGNNQYLLLKTLQKTQPPLLHPLLIGRHLVEPYYFSFSTAAAYHGFTVPVTHQVYIVTTNIRNNTDIKAIPYRFICVTPRKFFGYTPVRIQDVLVNMADKEKTIVDCLEKFKHIGSLVDVVHLLQHNISTLDIQRLVEYTVLMGSSTLVQRLGYLLDHLNVSFDEDFLRSYSLGVLSYIDPSRTYDLKPKRDEKWNLMINIPESIFGQAQE